MDKNSSNKQYSSVKSDEALKVDDQLGNKNAGSTDTEDDLKVYESCGCCFGVRYLHHHPLLCLSNHLQTSITVS